ncbi:hypothetical protein ANO14919_111600 [Xylariales sp. No.14919]|nr:hypothetical protein F5X98DRAFT_375323 [Xylaria grammica]GAW21637.1 hypothetical protein ANO14919_111600 [Xylariales sp. No.14919]
MASSNREGRFTGRVNLSNWGCHIQVLMYEFPDENRVELRHSMSHARGSCRCRYNPDPEQETKNDEVLRSHVYSLPYLNGTLMATTFASLKMMLAVDPRHILAWDGDKKEWIAP